VVKYVNIIIYNLLFSLYSTYNTSTLYIYNRKNILYFILKKSIKYYTRNTLYFIPKHSVYSLALSLGILVSDIHQYQNIRSIRAFYWPAFIDKLWTQPIILRDTHASSTLDRGLTLTDLAFSKRLCPKQMLNSLMIRTV
jgi:hypothetical protein